MIKLKKNHWYLTKVGSTLFFSKCVGNNNIQTIFTQTYANHQKTLFTYENISFSKFAPVLNLYVRKPATLNLMKHEIILEEFTEEQFNAMLL